MSEKGVPIDSNGRVSDPNDRRQSSGIEEYSQEGRKIEKKLIVQENPPKGWVEPGKLGIYRRPIDGLGSPVRDK